MEKNQHNQGTSNQGGKSDTEFKGNQPGQQLPADASFTDNEQASNAALSEQHSEDSLPQKENETLGTP